ncbi:LamG domain-containing protein, partial [Patescibacteria group bacterium]|nr:LamG domain-containing protein [Patescibacteria group bacterium]
TNGDNAGVDVFDETSNNYDGEFYGTNIATAVVDGISGKARNFNGTNDYIESDTQIVSEYPFTLSAWVKTSDTSPEFRTIISLQDKDVTSVQYAIILNTDGYARLWARNTTQYGVSTTDKVNDGKWHHIVGVFSSNTDKKIYQDGKYYGSETASITYNSAVDRWSIGRFGDSTPGYYFPGSIDEPMVLNTSLSAENVEELYRMGKDYRVSTTINSTDLSSVTKIPFWVASDRPGTFLSTSIGESAYVNYQPDGNTVGLWHLEERGGNNSYIKDSSGNQLHGAPTGTDFVVGKIGQGRNFDNTNDYITVAHNALLNITSAITLEAWINPTSLDSAGSWNRVISKGASTQYALATTTASDYGVVFELHLGGAIQRFYSYMPPQLGVWTHVAGTYNGSRVKIYMNGQMVSNNAYTGGIGTTASALIIGDWSSLTRKFDGIIDEVRISNTARTADQIRQTYEVGRRSHPITIDFGASLDSGGTGGLITSGTDLTFTIDSTAYGATNQGDNLYEGETVIVKEVVNDSEYIAQGDVKSVTAAGEVEVHSWNASSSFPSSGFTNNADVFKWQREFFDVSSPLDTHVDGITNITFRVTNGAEGRNVWVDDIKSTSSYMTNPSATSNITSTLNQYIKYKAILSTTDGGVTPYLSSVTLNYTPAPFTNEIMRHGKWFWDTDGQQKFWWAR